MMAGVTRDLFPLQDNDFDDDDCPGRLIFCCCPSRRQEGCTDPSAMLFYERAQP